MSIFKGSRYEGSFMTVVTLSDGSIRKYVHPRQPALRGAYPGSYVMNIRQNQLLDEIAFRFNMPEENWWVLAETSDIICALNIEEGTDIIIPGV